MTREVTEEMEETGILGGGHSRRTSGELSNAASEGRQAAGYSDIEIGGHNLKRSQASSDVPKNNTTKTQHDKAAPSDPGVRDLIQLTAPPFQPPTHFSQFTYGHQYDDCRLVLENGLALPER